MVDDSHPHIIGITKHLANKDITDAELGQEGYVRLEGRWDSMEKEERRTQQQ